LRCVGDDFLWRRRIKFLRSIKYGYQQDELFCWYSGVRITWTNEGSGGGGEFGAMGYIAGTSRGSLVVECLVVDCKLDW
jgi:hypothetical protein